MCCESGECVELIRITSIGSDEMSSTFCSDDRRISLNHIKIEKEKNIKMNPVIKFGERNSS